MSIERYRGFEAQGLARPNGCGGFQAHGVVSQLGHVLRESIALAHYASKETAEYNGLLWARSTIDELGESIDGE